ncbi:M48 family metallopeptidase [Patescibacteria group bacterium]|nr:M48 family metallopeptidase [Patescibacteria group bacterium]
MASIYTHQDRNIRKTWLLMGSFLIIVIGIGWAFSWYMGSPIILYIAVAIAFFMNFFSYWYSDKLVIKMTGAKPVTREAERELWNIVENLSITAGLPMPKLYIIDDPAPNAFATGRNPEHAVVAVTTGILKILNRTELEGVLAHELSHVGNRDMLVSTVAVVLVGFVAILADIFIRMTFWGGRGGGNRGGRLQIILLIVGIIAAILAPIAARLIHLAISRKREFLADASGALLTRYPEGLASALEKISAQNQPMKRQSHATAHLFISNPLGSGKSKGSKINALFSTHPPVEERTRALRGQN